MQLDCPFCNKPYTFTRGEVCFCPWCELEISSPVEPAPCIESSRKRCIVATALLVLGIVSLFLFPPYGAAAGLIFLIGFFVAADKLSDRCGNCGAQLKGRFTKWCAICGADLKGFVR